MKHYKLETHSVKVAQPNVPTSNFFSKDLTANHSVSLLISSSIAVLMVTIWKVSRSHRRAIKSKLIDEIRCSDIPCQRCRFYYRESTLRCAVHPLTVYTDQSVDCPDYHPSQP